MYCTYMYEFADLRRSLPLPMATDCPLLHRIVLLSTHPHLPVVPYSSTYKVGIQQPQRLAGNGIRIADLRIDPFIISDAS